MSAKRMTSALVRHHFWLNHPEHVRVKGRPHNRYNADVRSAFTEFVDVLRRNDQITERVAQNVTL